MEAIGLIRLAFAVDHSAIPRGQFATDSGISTRLVVPERPAVEGFLVEKASREDFIILIPDSVKNPNDFLERIFSLERMMGQCKPAAVLAL